MTHARQSLGWMGEEFACAELQNRGYVILARRYRRRGGELDIVAREGQTVVFVEVKTRKGQAFGSGPEAVTARKRRRMIGVATDFLSRHDLTHSPCRFDVVAVDMGPDGPRVELYRNAFDAT